MKRLILLVLVSVFMFSCEDDSWKQELENIKTELANQKQLIEALQQSSTVTNIEQGDGQYTINFSDGQSITLSNGKTPIITIGDNGNWYIDGIDTGKPSQGEDGADGADGENGQNGTNGADGKTPTIEIGTNGNWIINGADTEIKAAGADGTNAPIITSIMDYGNMLIFYFSDSSTISCIKKTIKISSEKWSGNVHPDETIFLKENFIRKNTFISCHITFDEFQPFLFGRGIGYYSGYYIDLQKDSVYVHNISSEDRIIEKYKHNLNFLNSVFVSIDYTDTNKALLSIHTGPNKFIHEITWWAGGATFIRNYGEKDIDVQLNFQAKDMLRPIWIIGDSYINWNSKERWPYYIYQAGYNNWLADHIPGGNTNLMLKSFRNIISYGTPIYAIWCMGMNDTSDKDIVNSTWLKNTQEFIKECESKGIIPILTTIPSVPNRNHKLKSEWVRNSGYRYIDFSSSVSKNDSSIWYNGTLNSDYVHPTALGAELMSNQVLIDFPEITIKE